MIQSTCCLLSSYKEPRFTSSDDLSFCLCYKDKSLNVLLSYSSLWKLTQAMINLKICKNEEKNPTKQNR